MHTKAWELRLSNGAQMLELWECSCSLGNACSSNSLRTKKVMISIQGLTTALPLTYYLPSIFLRNSLILWIPNWFFSPTDQGCTPFLPESEDTLLFVFLLEIILLLWRLWKDIHDRTEYCSVFIFNIHILVLTLTSRLCQYNSIGCTFSFCYCIYILPPYFLKRKTMVEKICSYVSKKWCNRFRKNSETFNIFLKLFLYHCFLLCFHSHGGRFCQHPTITHLVHSWTNYFLEIHSQ